MTQNGIDKDRLRDQNPKMDHFEVKESFLPFSDKNLSFSNLNIRSY